MPYTKPPLDPDSFPLNRALRAYHVQALETAMRQAETALAFLQARLEADRSFGHALTAAQSAAEAMDLWATYWQETLSDYSAQSAALASDLAQLPQGIARLAGGGPAGPDDATASGPHRAPGSDGDPPA